MNALELKQVSKRYPGFRLENLTLALPGGCILGLIGENGAGKSTTIRLMLGLAHPDSGSIKLLDRDIDDDLRLTKEDIGVAPKNVELLREEHLKKIEQLIDQMIQLAASCNISHAQLLDMVRFSLEEQI